MRKAQKQEILDFIESLHQAHEEIKAALQQNNLILVQNMLAECQEFAISLGENIEKLEGEGHVTVSCIEEYCETIFHTYKKIADNQFHGKQQLRVFPDHKYTCRKARSICY